MKRATLVKALAVAVVVSSFPLVPSVSFAGADDGVRCPSGFTGSFSNGVFKCTKHTTTQLEVRAAACPLGTINYTTVAGGRDFCVNLTGQQRVNAVPLAVLDPQNWRLDQDGAGGGQDRFLKGGQTQTQFAFPDAVNLL